MRIGKVIELLVSGDSMIRGACVRLPNSTVLRRPANKLYPIESTQYSPYTRKKCCKSSLDDDIKKDIIVLLAHVFSACAYSSSKKKKERLLVYTSNDNTYGFIVLFLYFETLLKMQLMCLNYE